MVLDRRDIISLVGRLSRDIVSSLMSRFSGPGKEKMDGEAIEEDGRAEAVDRTAWPPLKKAPGFHRDRRSLIEVVGSMILSQLGLG